MRLDIHLRERMGFRSRHHARQEIKAGNILVNGKTVKKPSFEVKETDRVQTKSFRTPYVSFGGVKLARALGFFGIDPRGRIVLDVGSSSGGFTDCVLRGGAKKVYAVDVGRDQLVNELKRDDRVVLRENTNFLDTIPEDFPGVELVVMDVSFTSSLPLLRHMHDMFPDVVAVVLFKPQFEGAKTNRSGIVKSESALLATFTDYLETLVDEGLSPVNAILSPRQEKKANREIFVHIDRDQPAATVDDLVAIITKNLAEEGETIC